MSSETNPEKNPDSADTPADAGDASPAPAHMYVNYLHADHNADIHTYRFHLSGSQTIQEAVEAAVTEIKNNPERHRVPGSPHRIFWNRPSYMVFVLDDPTAQLTDVKFCLDGTEDENHTFRDGTLLNDFGDCSAIYYLNIRKNRHGHPLADGEGELYYWEAGHTHRMKSAARRVNHDNSGTNIGP